MLELILPVLVAAALLATFYYFLKEGMKLLANAAAGLIILLFVNWFNLLSLVGVPGIPITWASVLICAFGGIPGAVILILLAIAGITV